MRNPNDTRGRNDGGRRQQGSGGRGEEPGRYADGDPRHARPGRGVSAGWGGAGRDFGSPAEQMRRGSYGTREQIGDDGMPDDRAGERGRDRDGQGMSGGSDLGMGFRGMGGGYGLGDAGTSGGGTGMHGNEYGGGRGGGYGMQTGYGSHSVDGASGYDRHPHYSEDGSGAAGFGDRQDWEDESRRGGSGQERGPHWGKGPKGYRRSDERIREDVCEAIARQGHVDASEVEVIVEGALVRLVGTVKERDAKRRIEMMVEHLAGVEDVRNELRVVREGTAQAQDAPGNAQSQPSARDGENQRRVHS